MILQKTVRCGLEAEEVRMEDNQIQTNKMRTLRIVRQSKCRVEIEFQPSWLGYRDFPHRPFKLGAGIGCLNGKLRIDDDEARQWVMWSDDHSLCATLNFVPKKAKPSHISVYNTWTYDDRNTEFGDLNAGLLIEVVGPNSFRLRCNSGPQHAGLFTDSTILVTVQGADDAEYFGVLPTEGAPDADERIRLIPSAQSGM
jgi:hypothetical protein